MVKSPLYFWQDPSWERSLFSDSTAGDRWPREEKSRSCQLDQHKAHKLALKENLNFYSRDKIWPSTSRRSSSRTFVCADLWSWHLVSCRAPSCTCRSSRHRRRHRAHSLCTFLQEVHLKTKEKYFSPTQSPPTIYADQTIEFGDVLQAFHVTSVAPSPNNEPNGAVRIEEWACQHCSNGVVYERHDIDRDVLPTTRIREQLNDVFADNAGGLKLKTIFCFITESILKMAHTESFGPCDKWCRCQSSLLARKWEGESKRESLVAGKPFSYHEVVKAVSNMVKEMFSSSLLQLLWHPIGHMSHFSLLSVAVQGDQQYSEVASAQV